MASLLTFLTALALADSSASLPGPLKELANSTDAFAAAIAALDKQTEAVVADAALVHKVASNKTARESVAEYMEGSLRAGMPSDGDYAKAEDAALKAAKTFQEADLASKQAELALAHERAWAGKRNLTAAEETHLEKLRNASRDAAAARDDAKAALEERVDKAERASAALLEATRAYTRTFEDHVDELMHASQRHEDAAKRAMRAAIAQGRVAADAERKRRALGEQKAEQTREVAEEWAEGHEGAIERASDHAEDDLERIYGPVKTLASKSRDSAEREASKRESGMHRLLENKERVALVQVIQGQDMATNETPQGTPWFMWAAGYSAAAAGALLVAVSKRRVGRVQLEQPLLG